MEEGTPNSVCNLWINEESPCLIKYTPAELKQLLIYAAIELDSIRASAQTQRQLHEAQIEQLEELVERVRRERDETREQCLRLTNKLTLNRTHYGQESNSDITAVHHMPSIPQDNLQLILKSLPQKGKLLEAVMQAGPLLQTLLVAGPLPQWRYPPPQLQSMPMPAFPEAIIPAGRKFDCFFCSNPGLVPPSLSTARSLPLWETRYGTQINPGFNPLMRYSYAHDNVSINTDLISANSYNNSGCEDCHDNQTASTATKPAGLGFIPPQSCDTFGPDRLQYGLTTSLRSSPNSPSMWNRPFF